MFKKFALTLATLVALTGCNGEPPLKYEAFNDTISSYNFVKTNGIAYGSKAFYVVYGQVGVDKAGTAIHFNGRKLFRLKDLLDKYPIMRNSPAVVKAEASQEKTLAKMFPKGVK